jgi:septum site-determining protein MinC
MAIASEDPSNPCYEIKSADLSLVALLLKTTDIAEVSGALKQQLAESPGFFNQDPLCAKCRSNCVEVAFQGHFLRT